LKTERRKIFNHDTVGAVGNIVNHGMEDAAPDTKRIFNHDLRDCADEEELARLLGVFKYPGRVLGETNPSDVIQLHPDLKSSWNWITDHYNRIGLPHTKTVIWDDNFDLIRRFPKHDLSVFFFGSKAHAVRPDERWYKVVKRMNSKNHFIKLCQDLSVCTPKTACLDDKDNFQGCDGFDFPVYFKISTSVSGLGVVKCRNEQELEKRIFSMDSGIDFQIQEEIKTDTFINVQYVVNSGHLEKVAITEQILEDCQHSGNRFPTKYDSAWEVTDPIAVKLWQEGMKGYFAFDLAVTDEKYSVIECNPRYNGSTYPTNIAKKLGIESWVAKNLTTNIRTLDDLNFEGIEYNPLKKSGIIVVNWGCISDGKIGVLIAGDQNEQEQIEEEFRSRI